MFFFTWFGGLDHKNLGILGCLLVTLWCILGLIFWGKLNVALTIRQRNYFGVGRRFNGDFEKNIGELEVPWVGGLFTPEHSTGYPDIPLGCPFASNGIDLALAEEGPIRCEDEEHWSVPPWMRLNANVAGILTECAKLVDPTEGLEESDPLYFRYPATTSLYNPTCIENFNPATGLTSCTPADLCVSAGVPIGSLTPPAAAAGAGGR